MSEARKEVRVAEGVVFRDLGNDAILLHLGTGRYFGLDPVAARMWTALEAAGTVEGAVDPLTEEYDVEPERLRRDLEELVAALAERHLVEWADADIGA